MKYTRNGCCKDNGRAKNDIAAYLHFAIRISVGVEEAVIVGDVVCLKAVKIWKGETNGRVTRGLLALKR